MNKYKQAALFGILGFLSLSFRPLGTIFIGLCLALIIHGIALRFDRYPLPKRFVGRIVNIKHFRKTYSMFEILFSITLLAWFTLTIIINSPITLFIIYTVLIFILLTYKSEIISQYIDDHSA